jgi:hypothetical protein
MPFGRAAIRLDDVIRARRDQARRRHSGAPLCRGFQPHPAGYRASRVASTAAIIPGRVADHIDPAILDAAGRDYRRRCRMVAGGRPVRTLLWQGARGWMSSGSLARRSGAAGWPSGRAGGGRSRRRIRWASPRCRSTVLRPGGRQPWRYPTAPGPHRVGGVADYVEERQRRQSRFVRRVHHGGLGDCQRGRPTEFDLGSDAVGTGPGRIPGWDLGHRQGPLLR